MSGEPINMASIVDDLARGPIKTGAEIAAAYHTRREAADVMYEALLAVIRLMENDPRLPKDDEMWGVFSQCVAAVVKARSGR